MKKNKLNILKYSLLFVFVSFLAVSCDSFLDVNRNPDVSTYVTPDESLPVIMFYASQLQFDHAEYGNYLAQTFTTGGRSQATSYAYKSGWANFLTMNRHPQWRRHFYDIGVNTNYLMEGVAKNNSRNFELIARSLGLMSTQMTTDLFGDMPLSEAYKGISPKYDTQESIYQWMLKEADDLLALYNDPAVTNNPAYMRITKSMDRVFEGDLTKWRSFTYAVKARILLRKLPNWENTPANCDLIIQAADAALADWVEPRYHYDGGSGERNNPWGISQPAVNGWESRKNEMDKSIPTTFFLVDMLGLYPKPGLYGPADDPRLPKLMQPRPDAQGNNSNIYRHLEANYGMDASLRETNYPDLFKSMWTTNTSYIPLISTEELMFIKAEAQYWKGDKAAAYQTALEAVKYNMERLGVTESAMNRYLRLAKYMPETDFNIGHLMRQKYIALYLKPEQWTDMRRYGYSNDQNEIQYDGVYIYPNLRRPYNLYSYWGNRSEKNGPWIQRINYDPETEEKYNRQELERLGAFQNWEWLKKPMIWGRQ